MAHTTCAVRRDDMENRIAALRKERRISQAELAEIGRASCRERV